MTVDLPLEPVITINLFLSLNLSFQKISKSPIIFIFFSLANNIIGCLGFIPGLTNNVSINSIFLVLFKSLIIIFCFSNLLLVSSISSQAIILTNFLLK